MSYPIGTVPGTGGPAAATVGEKGEGRLRPHFRLPVHVRENLDGRLGALLPAKAEGGDKSDADQEKDEEKAAEHISLRESG